MWIASWNGERESWSVDGIAVFNVTAIEQQKLQTKLLRNHY